jgi:hypothetical protein
MERKTYLGRYQVSLDERGEPIGLDRTASAASFKAEDSTTGEPVVVQVVRPGPLEQIPTEQVQADARAAQQLDHINIAKLRDFGFDGTDIVYVREFLEGSTLDLWVVEHGPLPVAAVMRIALQGVNALAAAAFQGVTHRSLQPANVMIVPGQTAEGDWPLIKILNFGGLAPVFSRSGFTTSGPGDLVQFASPEQLQGAKPDFKSDIYSLGATLWYLLTGAAPRAGMLERSRGIPKNVAAVVSRMLAANPEHRPVDPLALQADIRECLGRAERRDSIGRRFGLPAKVAKPSVLAAAVAPPPLSVAAVAEENEKPEPAAETAVVAGPPSVGRFLLRPLAWAAAILTAGAIAAMTIPPAVRAVGKWQAARAEKQDEIGVKVGVPDRAADAVAAVPTAPSPATTATETAAPAAPEVSPPQDTAVAANRTAPAAAASPSFPSAGTSEQSQPTVAAAPATTKLPEADSANQRAAASDSTGTQTNAPTIASAANSGTAPVAQTADTAEAPARQQQTSPPTATSRAPVVAANTAPAAAQNAEPAAPAEGPDDSAANARNNTRQTRTAAKRETQAEPAASQPAAGKAASASAEGERRPARTASTSKARAKAADRTGLTAEELTELEVRQALPITPADEAALPPVPRGSKRARFLGTTPDGALVFGMPQSSERVYAAPPPAPERSSRRSRRAAPQESVPPRAEPVDPEELEEVVPPPDEDEE